MNSAAACWTAGTMLVGFAMPAVPPGPWLALNPPGAPAHALVELDVSSIRQGVVGPEAVIRVSPRSLQGDADRQRAYRSWRMHVAFDCRSRLLEPLAVDFYSGERGQGAELGARTNLSRQGVPDDLLAMLSPPVRLSLLRAACHSDAVLHR